MIYELKVQALNSPYGHKAARRWQELRTGVPRATQTADYMRGRAEGRSVVDVGCMWKIHGAHCFMAEDLGATRVVGVDLYSTAEFERARQDRGSKVEFYGADATEPGVLKGLVGPVELVWCFGVLYHVPDPCQLLRNLREICITELVLETFTIPEVPGVPQAACLFPYLSDLQRRSWEGRRARPRYPITKPLQGAAGFDNNFWGLSTTAVVAALRLAGFVVDHHEPSLHGTLRTVFFARPDPNGGVELQSP